MVPPFNLKKWIDENRHLLKPPVGNQVLYQDTEFIVMIVGGPNSRRDYHVNRGEEFFFQLEGDAYLLIKDEKKHGKESIQRIDLREGDVFLLPPSVPHSPRRPAGTVGLVVERKRAAEELDGFQWYCENCSEKLYEKFIPVKNIVTDLPLLFQEFYSSNHLTTCQKCGTPHAQN